MRSKLLMPEYGRNVQRMVEYLLTIEDPAKRLKNAEAVIELMGTLNPHLKTIEDYKHKLWDHLHQMTDFRLEVASPYPAPTPEELFAKPERLPYPKTTIQHRHMGKNLENLLEKALAETDPEKRQGLTQAVGYYMKLAYTNWHKEPVHDDMIKNELSVLTNGQLVYETGGYKVHFDPRTNFKPRNNNNNNNRNFKGGGGGNQRNFGNNANAVGGRDRGEFGSNGGGNGYNKNRKFKNNNNKNK